MVRRIKKYNCLEIELEIQLFAPYCILECRYLCVIRQIFLPYMIIQISQTYIDTIFSARYDKSFSRRTCVSDMSDL